MLGRCHFVHFRDAVIVLRIRSTKIMHIKGLAQCLAHSRWAMIVKLLFLPRSCLLCCKVVQGQRKFPLQTLQAVLLQDQEDGTVMLTRNYLSVLRFLSPGAIIGGSGPCLALLPHTQRKNKRGLGTTLSRAPFRHRCSLVYQLIKTQV